jgi:hypothetical protein
VPVPADRVTASVALETLRPASESQVRVAPPAAVKVNAAGPGAIRGVVPKGMATQAPGVVITVAGMLRVGTERLEAVGDGAVPDEPNASADTTVKLADFKVWATT